MSHKKLIKRVSSLLFNKKSCLQKPNLTNTRIDVTQKALEMVNSIIELKSLFQLDLKCYEPLIHSMILELREQHGIDFSAYICIGNDKLQCMDFYIDRLKQHTMLNVQNCNVGYVDFVKLSLFVLFLTLVIVYQFYKLLNNAVNHSSTFDSVAGALTLCRLCFIGISLCVEPIRSNYRFTNNQQMDTIEEFERMLRPHASRPIVFFDAGTASPSLERQSPQPK